MPYAFGHLIIAWLAGKGYELISKKPLSRLVWFFLLLGAILPDSDYLIDLIFKTQIHRTITHSLLMVMAAPLIVFLLFHFLKNEEKKIFALALGTGILIHLSLDILSPQGLPLLWPYLQYFSPQGIGPYNFELALRKNTVSYLRQELNLIIFDCGLGLSWLFYLWHKRKITF